MSGNVIKVRVGKQQRDVRSGVSASTGVSSMMRAAQALRWIRKLDHR